MAGVTESINVITIMSAPAVDVNPSHFKRS